MNSNLLALPLLAAGAWPSTTGKDKAEITEREQFAFAPGGVVEIVDSFGELRVEGWDRPDVEVLTIRASRKRYEPDELDKGLGELERIVITPLKTSETRFVITTEFPSRNLFSRPLRGKTNVELEYHIKVPRQSSLYIKHDIGEVNIIGVAGNIEATSRIGEITLRVPEDEFYRVDARTRIGEVNSEVPSHPSAAGRRLYLRVGIGEINIHKLPSARDRIDAVTVD